ncbi:MAG: phenylphosphate carboxylase subunit delta [Bdellovibrionaceae bacterium]|nr:phenylphosphate carboxylase subunit delta [Pseudobdellovibrionaceae bacterium]|tara:strand:- start:1807 stop:2340 length:534 start_codon:yes stop_codon:yes gene_type:complete
MLKNLKDPEIIEKIKKIKLAIFDVDGILTDGKIYWISNDQTEPGRAFHVIDGYGLALLARAKFPTAVITAAKSVMVRRRLEFLGITEIYMGSEDKLSSYEKLLAQYSLKDEDVSFMADDLFDVPVLKKVGLSVTVPHASDWVKSHCHAVSSLPGGQGAAREFIDLIREANKIGPEYQ